MAKIVFEKRSFKDNNTGVVTEYEYYAVRGTAKDTLDYEVQLKNLVQSEKMALRMLYDKENEGGDVVTRKATESEQPTVTKSDDDKLDLNKEDGDKGWFNK